MHSSAPARAADCGTARILVLPGSPALFSPLSGEAAADNAQMLAAIDELLRAHLTALTKPKAGEPTADVHIVSSQGSRWYTAHRGSLRAWGVTAHVAADALPAGQGHHLGEIIARLLLERAGVEPSRITEVRGDIGQPSPDVVTVVVLDGSAGLDARAPLSLLPTGPAVHDWCRRVLQGAQPETLADASWLTAGGIVEPALWLELAALSGAGVQGQIGCEQIVGGVARFAAALEIAHSSNTESGTEQDTVQNTEQDTVQVAEQGVGTHD